MAATITGTVFNDLNHNGQFNPGEPGIPNVSVVLYSNSCGTCVSTLTNVNGVYSFPITVAGSYFVYETVTDSGASCPPTTFSQPSGFTMSNGPRKLTVTITKSQISNNATVANQNFSHDTTNNPLSCNTTMIQFAGRPSVWYYLNVVTGATVIQGTVSPPVDINAIGYNPLDNYIYGYDQLNNNLVRVDNSGNVTTLFPLPPGFPSDSYTTGTFDLNGFFYIFVNKESRFYVIDLRPNASTYLKLVNPANEFSEQTSNFGVPLSSALNVSGWVYNSSDSRLYGITPTGLMERVNPATGAITNLTTTPRSAGPFGAAAIDFNHNIYAISNSTGNIYRYTIVGNTATATLFSNTATTSFNDATLCPQAVINLDVSDTSDTVAGNGLVLGTQITSELDADQNSTVTGDDISKGIQIDGLSVPLTTLSVSATSYTLLATVTNTIGSTANLYGWLDFNTNGIFQGNEAAPVQVVSSRPGTQIVPLTFTLPPGVILAPTQTFVRLKFTTDTLVNQNISPTAVDTRSLGAASDGEVEDHILEVNNIADLLVDKSNTPIPVFPGQELEYYIKVINNGPDAALNVLLTDLIPPEVLNPEYSLNGGATFLAWTGSIGLGTLPANESIPVLIRGTVSDTAVGTIINTAIISSTTEAPDPINNTSTSFATVNQSADVSVIELADPTLAVPGDLLTYSIIVSNAGPSLAENVMLVDAVPSQMTNPEFSVDGGITFNPWDGSYNIGTLINGNTVIIILQGIVSHSSVGTIINTTAINSTTPDPELSNNTSTSVTPIMNLADLTVEKTVISSSVTADQVLTPTIFTAIAEPSNAENVTLTEGRTTNPSAVSPNIKEADPDLFNTVSVTNDDPSDTEGVMLIDADPSKIINPERSKESVTGNITNTVIESLTAPDPDSTNNTSRTGAPVNASSDLSIVKTTSSSTVISGQLLTYNLLVTNEGPSDADNVVVTNSVPNQLINVEFSIDGGRAFNPWSGSYTIGTLGNSFGLTIIIRGTVINEAVDTITNTAIVSSTTPDPDPTNNTSTIVIPVNASSELSFVKISNANSSDLNLSNNTSTISTPINISADLSVVKTASPNPVAPGQPLTYTVVVSNTGPSNAENVTLIDAVSNVLSNVEFSTNEGTTFAPWGGSLSIGALSNGASNTILIRGIVNTFSSGPVSNTAIVSTTTTDLNPANNTSTVTVNIIGTANVSIVKFGCADRACPGQLISYTLVVSNAGPSNAENVTLTDIVSSMLRNVEFSTNGGLNYSPWSGSYALGTLANGSSVTVIIRGKISSFAEDMISNTATVSASTPDPVPTNNSSTFVIHIQKGEECQKCGKDHKCDSCKNIRKPHKIKRCKKCTKTHKCDKCRRAAQKRKNRSRKALKLKRK
ncbi:DUF6923 family protein [Paenibacillus sp. B-A-8]|uniref:DUF6923 family protein n=1 Tax=Paenibacillus sp. B-A-8 TaxID=3400419 RepID=UPI003B027121